MAFCMECGQKVPDGKKFCPNCGASLEMEGKEVAEVTAESAAAERSGDITAKQSDETAPEQKNGKSALDTYGAFIGLILFVLEIIMFMLVDMPFLKIAGAVLIFAGTVWCLAHRFKLKFFTIVAMIIAILMLLGGISSARMYGLFHTRASYGKSSERNYEEEERQLMQQLAEEDRAMAEANANAQAQAPAATAKSDPSQAAEAAGDQTKAADVDQADNAASQTAEAESLTDSKSADAGSTAGVDPELKKFLDSYESFVGEYVSFMKKYMADPGNALSMLSDYADITAKYADFAEKLDAYDEKKMSDADLKYYAEVTERCSLKMLDVLQ